MNKKNYDAQLLEVQGKGERLLSDSGWIFNTEAHPVDPSALRLGYFILYGEILR